MTGEYPPQFGGVADYSALVASGLAQRGYPVHVWAPTFVGEAPEVPGVTVHRDAGRWSSSDLAKLSEALDAMPAPRRLLVQYTPNAWGFKGANLGFGRWLARRRAAGDTVWTMVHEAVYPWQFWDKPTRWLLAALHRLMLRDLVRASHRIYLSTNSLKRHFTQAPARTSDWLPVPNWLPVPSNIPVVDDPAAVAAIRARMAPRGESIIGHFSTYARIARRPIPLVARELLAGHPDRVLLLIGREGESMAEELATIYPDLAGRVKATGALAHHDVSLHLQACDVMLQHYDDGVSGRRGTMMACLAHARPTATNLGRFSDPVWAESGGVAVFPRYDPAGVVGLVDSLLADPTERAALSSRAKTLYDGTFSVDRVVETLVRDAEQELASS